MKYLKSSALTCLMGILLIGLSTDAFAQNQKAAFEAYNKALELAKSGQYEQAINMFNQAISNAEELGEEGKDIIQRSQKQLPPVHYQMSLAAYRTFQQEKSISSLEETINSFQETGQVAEELGNTEIVDKTGQVITQLLYTKSLLQFQTENYDESLASLDQAISRNPNYAKAYYQKGIVAKRQEGNSLDEVLGYFDKAIEIGNKTNDVQTVRNAKEAASEELLYNGALKINEEQKFDEAVSLLKRALEYDPSSADIYYRLAEAYNKQALWDSAIEHANKALELESGGRTDLAKIYFELGLAYQNKGNKKQACGAYENAAYGSFKAPAEHQMEFELECKSTTN